MSDKKIAIIYGSDTGATENVANLLNDKIGPEKVELLEVSNLSPDDFLSYDIILMGIPTWYIGELQSDWDSFFEEFQTIDFKGKKVAIFGIGDQYSYADTFIDGVGIIGKVIKTNNGILIGEWPTDGYFHDSSVAELEMGTFCGLAIDEDNQSDMTTERLEKWSKQILREFTQ